MLVLYSNGIIEEGNPKDVVYTDEELTGFFGKDFKFLVSHRLPDIPNTWCLWGEMEDPPENEYNRIGSEIVDAEVLSHICFIHDSEINPDWNMSDTVLYKDYKTFIVDIGVFIDDVIADIMREPVIEDGEEVVADPENPNMIFLTSNGYTSDKRVLFDFDPNEQAEGFYNEKSYAPFAEKIYEYLNTNFYENPVEINHPLVIFADTKTIISVKKDHTQKFFGNILDFFTKKEKYEICGNLTSIQKAWIEYDVNNESIKKSISEMSVGSETVEVDKTTAKKTNKKKVNKKKPDKK